MLWLIEIKVFDSTVTNLILFSMLMLMMLWLESKPSNLWTPSTMIQTFGNLTLFLFTWINQKSKWQLAHRMEFPKNCWNKMRIEGPWFGKLLNWELFGLVFSTRLMRMISRMNMEPFIDGHLMFSCKNLLFSWPAQVITSIITRFYTFMTGISIEQQYTSEDTTETLLGAKHVTSL